jgi:hypothetical protein
MSRKLKFLPGTTQAEIEGDAKRRARVAFDAAAGEAITLDLTGSPSDGSARLSVERDGTEVLAGAPARRRPRCLTLAVSTTS